MFKSKITTLAAFTALAVAVLGATPVGHAAGKLVLGRSSVGTAQLKKNAVTTAKVRNRSLLAVDFKKGQLPAGPQGPKGDQGAKGDPGVAHLQVMNRQSAWAYVPAGAIMTASAHCQANEVATGGGPVGMDPTMVLISSNAAEVPTPTTWRVTVKNNGGMEHSFSVEVVCATA
jgi:hypothetical protein